MKFYCCNLGSPVYEHQFVLLYFDLKIDRLSRSTLKKAGELLAINFIVHLFGKGSIFVHYNNN